MRLEDRAISAKREELLHGSAQTLCKAWREHIKGGNEHGVFDEMLARDVIAYTLIRYVE